MEFYKECTFALRPLCQMYKKIKFNFYVLWEKIYRSFASMEEVEYYVQENYNIE